VHVAYTESEEQLRKRLREYYDELLDDETRAELHKAEGVGPIMRRVVRQMGEDGWLGIGWPTEYGGQGRSQLDQLIFLDEAAVAGVPIPFLTLNTVGPTIMRHGSEAQKRDYLPRIAGGELHFAIGYSEPGAGTDLASLRTKAERDGDEYVINGQKMWTSLVGYADYIWLACRTDPEAQRHRGLSVLVVPTDAPGFSWTPVRTMAGPTTSATYYQDVRVPVDARIGAENEGWALITNQLNHERVTLCSPGMAEQMLHNVIDWASEMHLPDGRRVIDQEWVQVNLARVHAKLEFLRLINWKVAWTATQGGMDVADASTIKVFGTEFYLEAFRLLGEVLGQQTYLRRGSPEAVLKGKIEQLYRSLLILTFGGGVNEVQRDLIAMFGLGLPRSR
jgi:3-oxocholest-4-en-26-oyl-CoA dehydrogenase alpha subunit